MKSSDEFMYEDNSEPWKVWLKTSLYLWQLPLSFKGAWILQFLGQLRTLKFEISEGFSQNWSFPVCALFRLKAGGHHAKRAGTPNQGTYLNAQLLDKTLEEIHFVSKF